ncbi:MAG: carbon-nitrogen hydrolase family protein [Thermoleophilaceae bacterium]|nr:carbon-nitrogen hydrolase family protein [Thermoleophilaceae bacterium]
MNQSHQSGRQVRAAAIQLSAVVADVDANLAASQRIAEAAAREGAGWIILPEFFTTGVAFRKELAHAGLAPDGAASQLMAELARKHGVTVGGSFLCRDGDGQTRNAFLLYGPDGELLGRHDKDLPTMWENCFYVGGTDDGVIELPDGAAGVALCWELIRSQTARRLAGRVEIVVGGSCWWTVPSWHPHTLTRRMESANELNAVRAAPRFARLVGAPVVHAAHCGPIECPMPWAPFSYRGRAEGGASVSGPDGTLLDFRDAREGEGFAIADVQLGARDPVDAIRPDYWLCDRGALPAFAWTYQRMHGQRWYARQQRR